jgi:hypothetical protein
MMLDSAYLVLLASQEGLLLVVSAYSIFFTERESF